MVAEIKKPVVYDAGKSIHREMITGAEVISGETVQLSTDADNSLSVGADGGLYVNAVSDMAALISEDTGNSIIQGTDKKLYSKKVVPADMLSTDVGNTTRLGFDNRLFTPKANPLDFISDNANNAIVQGTDNKLFAAKVTPTALVSTDGGNDLKQGTDGKLYVNVESGMSIDANDKVLAISANGILANIRLNYITATGHLQLVGRDNNVLSDINLPEHQILESAQVVTNPPAQPSGTYIEMVFKTETGNEIIYVDVTSLIVNYIAGNAAIAISGYNISLVVDNNSALMINATGLTLDTTKLVSTQASNKLIRQTDGTLYVATVTPDSMLSTNTGNAAYIASDGKIFVPEMNGQITPGGGLAVDENGEVYVDIRELISTDTDNTLGLGSDDKLKVIGGAPGTMKPMMLGPNSEVGTSLNYAREDHVHTDAGLAAPDYTMPQPLGIARVGINSRYYSRSDHVHPQVDTSGNATSAADGTIGIVQSAKFTDIGSANKFVSPAMLLYAFPNTGGFKVDGTTGKRSVDFSQMPQSQIDVILGQIRVPIWLSNSTNFYVNTSSGVDNQAEGRGLTSSMPWKSIQYALDTIASTYNFSTYNGVLNVVGNTTFTNTRGIYLRELTINGGEFYIDFGGSTLQLNLSGSSAPGAAAVSGQAASAPYALRNGTIGVASSATNQIYPACLYTATSGAIRIVNMTFNVADNRSTPTGGIYGISVATNGNVRIEDNVNINGSGSATNPNIYLLAVTGGIILYAAYTTGMALNGKVAMTMYVEQGSFNRNSTAKVPTGTVIGQRYSVRRQGYCNTYGGGETFFPGTIAGYVEASTYAVFI